MMFSYFQSVNLNSEGYHHGEAPQNVHSLLLTGHCLFSQEHNATTLITSLLDQRRERKIPQTKT
jgi:hypothetical protein